MQAKVLLLSERRIADLVAFCAGYEFEDTFATVADAQRIDVIRDVLPPWWKRGLTPDFVNVPITLN